MKKILLVGKPNSGKSLLFNRLTGLDQKVANFPGVTVSVKTGDWKNYQLVDFPGVYSLSPVTTDENISLREFHNYLQDTELHLVVCVLDSTQMERSLTLALQVAQECSKKQKPILFAFNMYDDVLGNHLKIDFSGLEKSLGIPCLPVSARSSFGLPELETYLEKTLSAPPPNFVIPVAKDLAKKFGPQSDFFIKRIHRWDSFLLSSWLGGPLFILMMLVLFQSLFTWATPLMDLTERGIQILDQFVISFLPTGILADFMSGAIFGGIGTFVVFVPQIFILTFIMGVLEDSGYLARIAIVCHRPLRFIGLSGKSFIPYLSGHACAIPAIYSARMIESPTKRLITILTIPLISCSARLPVYSLLIVACIPDIKWFGIIGVRGFTFFVLFFLGYISAFAVSALLARFIKKDKNEMPFVIEMPTYRRPFLKPLLLRSIKSSWDFLSSAGPVIFITTLCVWILGYFPNANGSLQGSWLESMGRWLEPIVQPMGLDWKFAVAILTSFIAREVFVGTLGTFYGIESADENVSTLAQRLQQSQLQPASGLALLVFYVIALQCVSTLAVIKKETGSRKIPVLVFIGYTALAYTMALISYRVLSFFLT